MKAIESLVDQQIGKKGEEADMYYIEFRSRNTSKLKRINIVNVG